MPWRPTCGQVPAAIWLLPAGRRRRAIRARIGQGLWLAVGVVTPGRGEDAAIALGDSLLSAGQVEQAATEYRRYLYFHPGDPREAQLHARIGRAYRDSGRWQKAADALGLAAAAVDDGSRDDLRIARAVVLVVSGNASGAELELLRVTRFGTSEASRKEALLILGYCQVRAHKWTEARETFRRCRHVHGGIPWDKVDSLLAQGSRLPHRSGATARWISTFIPGGGQVYAGDWRDGLNAFAVNAVFGYLLADALLQRHVVDALFGYLTFAERYYRGNRRHAEEAAQHHNEQVDGAHARAVESCLSGALAGR